jgi:signal transduction histidine kinase/CheY-like chemotaxis protein
MNAAIASLFTRLVARFPEKVREGKMLYAFSLVTLMVGVLVVFAFISPNPHAKPMFFSAAFLLLCLMGLVLSDRLTLDPAVHIGLAVGYAAVLFSAWTSGGVLSPRMGWLLTLPVTSFYLHGRRAGLVWSGIVLLTQLGMAWLTVTGRTPYVELGDRYVLPSWFTVSMITPLLIVVPFIYGRLYNQALEESRVHQQTLEQQRRELEHTLQMREYFVGAVSHELRTPMNAILGFNALLLARVKDRPEALKLLNHTQQSAAHLMTVINDILDYSQLQTGKLVVHPETFELRTVVQHAFDLFRPKVKSMSVDYRIELDEDLPVWVYSDRHRLMQVLVNLLGNALKFTHHGEVVLRVQWQNPGVLFSVKDTGIGIAPEQQPRIFRRFAQAENDTQTRYGGNGLGLAISRQLVDLLGGEIGFESQPGQGSTFWLRLPLSASEAPVRPSGANHDASPMQTQASSWSFLVVDDHPVNRLLAKRVLQTAWPQAQVIEAVDGQQALELLAYNPVDLVLMDMVMPVMDGTEATRRLRQNPAWENLPVLGLTANVNPIDLETFLGAGLSGVMLKPIEPSQLCTQVEQLLMRPAARLDLTG